MPVNHAEAAALVRSVITDVAPDVEVVDVLPDTELHTDLELDSMDFLNIAAAVRQRSGIEIPEHDFPRLATIGAFTDYLVGRSAGDGAPARAPQARGH